MAAGFAPASRARFAQLPPSHAVPHFRNWTSRSEEIMESRPVHLLLSRPGSAPHPGWMDFDISSPTPPERRRAAGASSAPCGLSLPAANLQQSRFFGKPRQLVLDAREESQNVLCRSGGANLRPAPGHPSETRANNGERPGPTENRASPG